MAREPYRFISYDSRDENLVQFHIREINGAPYIQFTYISPRDKRWADTIEANDIIFFIQDNVDVASAVIAAPYDSENGFRLEGNPLPSLNEGNYYGIDYSRDRPEDDRDVPVENRGWSPLYGIQYLNFDDPGYSVTNTPTTHFAFRLVDWTSGRGTKPQLGFLGLTGIVADVNNAAILTLPPGPRGEGGRTGTAGADGTRWTEGTTLSNGNVTGDMHLFPEAVASGLTNYFQADGTTAKADAEAGEVARWDGTKWRFVMVLSTGGLGGIFIDMHDGLRDATADDYGKVGIGPDGKLYRVKRTANPGHDAAGTFNAYTHRLFRGVAHNRPSNPQVDETYYNIRIHQWYVFFRNLVVATIDAQPITAIQALGANTVWIGEVDDVYQARHAIQNFDNTKAYYAVYGETLYVLDNSTYVAATTETTYTYRWVELLPDDIITSDELTAALQPFGFSFIEVLPRKARIDELYKSWIISLGQVYSPYDTANRVEVFLDFTKVYDSAYNPATDRFIKFDISNANAGTIQGNTQGTDTHWEVELRFFNNTTRVGVSKFTSVVISREPEPNPFDNEIIRALEAKTADLFLETAETWAAATDASFLALPADNAQLARVRSGNVPQGLTGWTTDVTTTEPRAILVRVPLTAQLADYRILLGDDNAVRLDAFGVNATGTQYAYMTSTSLTLQAASRIRLQHHGTATHTRFIGMLADAIMARLLPALPAEGQRESKVPQFDGNNLVWQVLTGGGGGGLTSSQLARLLPSLPSEGDRNLKIAQFVNDVLTWKAIEGFVTQEAFDSRRNHTPNRVRNLPVRLDPQEQLVLVENSHWSDKFYRFRPAGHDVTRAGDNYRYAGVNTLAYSTDLPVFGNAGLPTIFRANRIAAFYGRRAGSQKFRPKIVIDLALVPTIPNPDDPGGARILDEGNFHISVDGGGFTRREFLERVNFDSDDSVSGSVNEITFGGKTYHAFAPGGIQSTLGVPGDRNRLDYNWLSNIADNDLSPDDPLVGRLDFHLSYTAPDGTVSFLSDDLNTVWAAGTEYVADLYEGDASGHPIRAALPSKELWDEVVARSDTYIRAAPPNNRFGIDGNKWFNLANGKGYIKTGGNWVEATDFALQSELNAIRQLPAFPAEGSRNDKIVRFADDVLQWEDLATVTGSADGKIIFGGTGSPANDAGKIGDTYLRRITAGRISLYEKTAATTWTYRYDMLLLPTFPSTGSRDNKILRFDGDTLGWEDLSATGGLTSAQAARLLPTLPGTGSRDDKFPIFNGNTLRWEDLRAIAVNWPSIPSNSPVAKGTLVEHGGRAFVAKTAHNRGGSGPDGDSTNWTIITNWDGAWRAAWFPAGTMVERSGNPYVALQNVTINDVAPDHASNTKWLRMNSDPPPPLRQALTSASTITWNVASGAVADLTLGHNVTLNISGGVDGDTAMLRCLQDTTGSRTLTFHSSIQRGGRDAPTLNTGAGKRDYLLFTRVGTTWIYLGIIADE